MYRAQPSHVGWAWMSSGSGQTATGENVSLREMIFTSPLSWETLRWPPARTMPP